MSRKHDDRLAVIEDWLYVVIVAALSLYLVIGIIAWAWMLLTGVAAPGAFTSILATIAGGLIGILTPLRGRRSRKGAEDPSPTERSEAEAEPAGRGAR